MNRAILGILLTAVLLAAPGVAAAGLPWEDDGAETPKDNGAETAAPAAQAPGVNLKEALTAVQYTRLIKPVEVQIEQAKKLGKLYEEEMAKEERFRNIKRALGYKTREANAYAAVMKRATNSANSVREEDIKTAVLAQFEKPAREHATKLYLQLAQSAMDERDVRSAVGYYRKVLEIDPENETATAQMTKIKEAVAQARGDAEGGLTETGGHGENERDFSGREDHEKKGREDTEKDYTKTGRESGGWKKGGASF